MTSSSLVPPYSLPEANRRVLLVNRPAGVPIATDFAFDSTPLEILPENAFRVRNIYLSVDPAQRGWAADVKNYSARIELGSVMRALAVGVIVESRHSNYSVGTFVYGWFGWQDYCVATADMLMTSCEELEAPLSAYAGVFGMPGLTAWLALNKVGRPKAGETVLVSTSAGAVGSVVGQIAREIGCRVLGLAGNDQKVERCTGRFGYHAAANYRSGDLAQIIASLAPNGIDIYFDNVGGTTLDLALRNMRVGGRIVQCGTASVTVWSPPPTGLRNEREVLMRQLIWGGFFIFAHASGYGPAQDSLVQLYRQGKLSYDEDILEGIETAPESIARVYRGENNGKQLIFVG